jgi:hypothetical protein
VQRKHYERHQCIDEKAHTMALLEAHLLKLCGDASGFVEARKRGVQRNLEDFDAASMATPLRRGTP